MKGIYKLIQEAAYEVLVDNRRNALLCSGKKVLYKEEGRMSAIDIALEINNNPKYGWLYPAVNADQVRSALKEVVMTDKRFAWLKTQYPPRIKFWAYCETITGQHV